MVTAHTESQRTNLATGISQESTSCYSTKRLSESVVMSVLEFVVTSSLLSHTASHRPCLTIKQGLKGKTP